MYNTFWAFLVSKKDHHSARLSLSRSRQGRAQLVREPKQEQIEQIELVSHLGPPRRLALLPFVPVIPAVHSFLSAKACILHPSLYAQQTPITYDSTHNVTPITGTWSTGSMSVVTGAVRMFMCSLCHLFTQGEMV